MLYNPAIPFLGVYQKNESGVSKRYLYTHLHGSIINNSERSSIHFHWYKSFLVMDGGDGYTTT